MATRVNVIQKRITQLKLQRASVGVRHEKALATAADRVDEKYKAMFAEIDEEIEKLTAIYAEEPKP